MKVKSKMKRVWITSDDDEFESKSEANEHQRKLDLSIFIDDYYYNGIDLDMIVDVIYENFSEIKSIMEVNHE